MDEILPDSAKSEEPRRLIRPGPEAQEDADRVGTALSGVEYKRCLSMLESSKLRTLYEIECVELGVEPTAWLDSETFSRQLKAEAERRFKLIVQAYCKRMGIVHTGDVIREFETGRRKFPLVYRSACFDEGEKGASDG